jgi:DNA-binding PadR family transcriptional regulator
LSRMAARGWLRVEKPARPHGPRVYRLTPKGRVVLNRVLDALAELIGEVGARHSRSH